MHIDKICILNEDKAEDLMHVESPIDAADGRTCSEEVIHYDYVKASD